MRNNARHARQQRTGPARLAGQGLPVDVDGTGRASWPERSALEHDVPRRFTAMSVWSVIGTLSLMDGTSDVRRLYHALGPVRFVSLRHVRRLVKWLIGEGWIFRQQNEVKSAEGQMFRLSDVPSPRTALPWRCGLSGVSGDMARGAPKGLVGHRHGQRDSGRS